VIATAATLPFPPGRFPPPRSGRRDPAVASRRNVRQCQAHPRRIRHDKQIPGWVRLGRTPAQRASGKGSTYCRPTKRLAAAGACCTIIESPSAERWSCSRPHRRRPA
jgi:hypothetical protein